jgi:hypothetical protein
MYNFKLDREVKKHSWMGEVSEGGEGPHWTILPSKQKMEEEEDF